METIILAAIKTGVNNIATVLVPGRHHDIIHHLAKSGFKTPITGEQGFITNEGRFVDRVEAKRIVIESGQLIKTEFSRLYSEDLWSGMILED